MLGPGMESKNTSKLFICLLRSRPDLFVIKGLLPGGQEGIGSGVELEFRGERRFNLIALYSNNRQARRDQVGLSRLLNSRILDVRLPNSEGSATTVFQDAFDNFVCVEHNFVLSSAVKNFLSGGQVGRRCLVYAVDASKEGQNVIDISTNRLELKTFLDGLQGLLFILLQGCLRNVKVKISFYRSSLLLKKYLALNEVSSQYLFS